MTRQIDIPLRKLVPLLATAFLVCTGCLYPGDPGSIAPDPEKVATMEGASVQLIRHSTGCGSDEARGVVVEVGPGVEYPADAVASLKTNCALGPNPGVEVHVEETSVVFDFSNVTEPGRFPEGEFEGYILEVLPAEAAPFLLAATVDWSVTSLELTDDNLRFEPGRLALNLADCAFDSRSFLKVDLFLASLPHPTDSP